VHLRGRGYNLARMKNMQTRRLQSSGRPARLWPSLLLGSLLVLFLVAFLYSGYLFLTWGRTVAASVPDLPALALPSLVRAAPARAPVANQPVDLFVQAAQPQAGNSPLPVSGRVTIIMMGVDNRPDEPIARTDSILVLTLNPKSGAAGMLSLPRDMLVHASLLDRDVKINTIHVLGEINKYPGGGPALLSQTVSELLGYPIDYYVRVNFDGFRQIIDLIGGIDIDVAKEIRDDQYPDNNYGYDPLYIPAGRQHMDGALALKYARTRHGDNDYERAARQQQVILAVKDKIMQPGQLASLLPRMPWLALALGTTVQTNMPIDKALALARNLDQVNLQSPTRVVIDQTMGETIPNDPKFGFILIPDLNKLRAAAAAVFADAPESAGDGNAVAAIPPDQLAQVRLTVLNGSAQPGLAATVATALANVGFNSVTVGNGEQADYAQSWLILHGDQPAPVRDLLVRRFGIQPDHTRNDPVSPDTDFTLILGADQSIPASGQ
jgi:polyisoprenyl-teichoic acid--peptidoglycan teichoic acid transferase